MPQTLQGVLAKLVILLISAQIALAASTSSTYIVYPPPRITAAAIFVQEPLLYEICSCESFGEPTGPPRQFNDSGTPLWGNDPTTGQPVMRDVGACQISLKYHREEAQKLGLDVINNYQDNVYYAYLLFQRDGSSDWNASKNCWEK